MNPKRIVAGTLLLFVGASVVYLVANEAGDGRKPARRETPASTGQVTKQRSEENSVADEPKSPQRKVIAYYFHGYRRCGPCRTIEAYATEAIQAGFPEALKQGLLEWHVVNVEQPGNRHFIEDFRLVALSVVVEDVVGGERRRWKNLERIWELLRDKSAFAEYVQDETRAFLEDEG